MGMRIRTLLLILITITLVFGMTACDSGVDFDEREEPAVLPGTTGGDFQTEGWTIFLYLCGSDLESDGGYATGDLEEIVASTYSNKVRVVIQTGGSSCWENENVNPEKTDRFVLTENGIEFVKTLPEANMGDASTLKDFLKWGIENYASQHMALVFWNHGGGSISGVCFDEKNDNDSLSLREIDTALKGISSKLEKPFEVIGFDACLMSTYENASMLAPYARYLYASEETEPGAGWNYTEVLSYLAENPNADGKALGEMQYMSYYNYCMQDGDDPTVTFAITDLSAISDLTAALDKVGKELLDAEKKPEIVRGIIQADNFGGNNRSEGYTNMVDLLDMLKNVASYAPSATEAIEALEKAVIYCKNASLHVNAGGLSIYYPLCVQDENEIPTFVDICPSKNYADFVSVIATGAVVSTSTNGTSAVVPNIEDSKSLKVKKVYVDEEGTYTVELEDMEQFAYATCTLYMVEEDDTLTYLGEDDDVHVSYENCTIQDAFDGSWLCLKGNLLPIETVSQNKEISLYSCEVLYNGSEDSTYLQICYDWTSKSYRILGIWNGVDSDTGMVARSAEPLKKGDTLKVVYWNCVGEDEWEAYASEAIQINGDLELEYCYLPAADYRYAINVYDIYGNVYQLDETIFNVDEDGEVYFYPDEE